MSIYSLASTIEYLYITISCLEAMQITMIHLQRVMITNTVKYYFEKQFNYPLINNQHVNIDFQGWCWFGVEGQSIFVVRPSVWCSAIHCLQLHDAQQQVLNDINVWAICRPPRKIKHCICKAFLAYACYTMCCLILPMEKYICQCMITEIQLHIRHGDFSDIIRASQWSVKNRLSSICSYPRHIVTTWCTHLQSLRRRALCWLMHTQWRRHTWFTQINGILIIPVNQRLHWQSEA